MTNTMAIIAEPMRREILRRVWDRESCVNDLVDEFAVSQPAISFHLRILRDGGLVRVRREGRRRYYSADRKALGGLEAYLEQFWGDRLERLKDAAEIEARRIRRENN